MSAVRLPVCRSGVRIGYAILGAMRTAQPLFPRIQSLPRWVHDLSLYLKLVQGSGTLPQMARQKVVGGKKCRSE